MPYFERVIRYLCTLLKNILGVIIYFVCEV